MAAAPRTPEQLALDEARRNRAALLRTFEGSTLSRANFCVLKGLTEAALESQLVLARQERGVQAPPPAQRDPTPDRGRMPAQARGPRRNG